MALIKCPECGKDVSENAENCIHCGYPLSKLYTNQVDVSETQNTYANNQENAQYKAATYTPGKPKKSILGILALVFSLIGCTFIIGLILAIIDLCRKDNRDKGYSFGAIIVCVIWISLFAISNIVGSKSETEETTQVESLQDETNDIVKDETEDLADPVNVPAEPVPEPDEQITEIFITDLLNSWSDYVGQTVTVSYPCGRCDEEDMSIESTYDENAGTYLSSYVDNYRPFEYEDYITVTGTVTTVPPSSYVLENAHIDGFGTESEQTYQAGLAVYKEEQKVIALNNRQDFIDNAIEVSYEDLRRYPDTYKDKPIKLKIYIDDVEPDGWIFQGDIIATIPGADDELAVYDSREVREPRFLEGDTIIVYATGNGLATMKIKQGIGIISRTVDEYEVPSIKVIYTDLDNLD